LTRQDVKRDSPVCNWLPRSAVQRCSYELQFIGPAAPCRLWHGFHTQFAVDSGPFNSQRRPATFTRSVGLLLCYASAACRYGPVPRPPRSHTQHWRVFTVIPVSFDSARRQAGFTRSVTGLRPPPRRTEAMSISSSALRRRAAFGADFIRNSRWILARSTRSGVQQHSPVP
jgi:hypothetical protein